MKRFLFLLLLVLFLFPSCSDKTESIGIWSEEGAYIYSNKDGNGKIFIDGDLMSILLSEGEESVEELFDGVEMYKLSPSSWRQREIVTSSLLSITGIEDVEKVYEKERKHLISSKWNENMKEISNGFEKRLMDFVKKNGGDFYSYSASSVVDTTQGDGERIRVFLKKWIKAIVG